MNITIPGDPHATPPIPDITIRPRRLVKNSRGTWALVSFEVGQKVKDHFTKNQYSHGMNRCPEIEIDFECDYTGILIQPKEG